MAYSLFLMEGRELFFVERAGLPAVKAWKEDKSKDRLLEAFGREVRVYPLFESVDGSLLLAYDLRRERGIDTLMPCAVMVNRTGREVVVEVKQGGRVGRLSIGNDVSVMRRPRLEFF